MLTNMAIVIINLAAKQIIIDIVSFVRIVASCAYAASLLSRYTHYLPSWTATRASTTT